MTSDPAASPCPQGDPVYLTIFGSPGFAQSRDGQRPVRIVAPLRHEHVRLGQRLDILLLDDEGIQDGQRRSDDVLAIYELAPFPARIDQAPSGSLLMRTSAWIMALRLDGGSWSARRIALVDITQPAIKRVAQPLGLFDLATAPWLA
jgi:hypothetical protein